ncbi:MAG TPA: hypothetical protein VH743_01875 [Beijerinckiaceae bacterium]|jgi:hypothetical protein
MVNALSAHWQPITTAPCDQDILVFSQRWGVIVANFRAEFSAWFPRMQCPAALGQDDAPLITHWMPLPPAPERSQHEPAVEASATGLPVSLARFVYRAIERDAA